MGWNTNFLLGNLIFRCELLVFGRVDEIFDRSPGFPARFVGEALFIPANCPTNWTTFYHSPRYSGDHEIPQKPKECIFVKGKIIQNDKQLHFDPSKKWYLFHDASCILLLFWGWRPLNKIINTFKMFLGKWNVIDLTLSKYVYMYIYICIYLIIINYLYIIHSLLVFNDLPKYLLWYNSHVLLSTTRGKSSHPHPTESMVELDAKKTSPGGSSLFWESYCWWLKSCTSW